MSHRPRSSLAIAIAAAILGLMAAPAIGVAAPRPIAVLPPSGDNIAPAILGAARDILKEQLHRTGAYAVIEPAGTPSAAEIPPAEECFDSGEVLARLLSGYGEAG